VLLLVGEKEQLKAFLMAAWKDEKRVALLVASSGVGRDD
jgi:hypothetical protein